MMSLDSLKRAQLKGILEQYYGAEIDPEFLFDVNTTFEQLVSAVDVVNWTEIECRNSKTESQLFPHSTCLKMQE